MKHRNTNKKNPISMDIFHTIALVTSFIWVAILDLSPALSPHIILGPNHLVRSTLIAKCLQWFIIDFPSLTNIPCWMLT